MRQTLRQLLPSAIESDECKPDVVWEVPAIRVIDEPRFGYRGLMVDVARHFITKDHLLRIIDTMGMLKLNKLHLHLTDDNGWRLEIKRYPLLTSVGSKTVKREGLTFPERRNARQGEPLEDGGFYTQEDIKEIVAYASNRQIEVIPEIAMPGHCTAALSAYPLLACPTVDRYIGAVPGLGNSHAHVVYCAGNEEVFTFLQNVLDEVIALFPSTYIHLGGDATHNTPWEDCPVCQERMKQEGIEGEVSLLGYFMRRIDRYVRGKGRKVMGWEEIMDANLSKGAVVFDWHGYGHGAIKAGKQGHDFIMAPTGTMYLNTYQGPQWHESVLSFGGVNTLKNIYDYEPVERYWTMSMRSHLLGVQANLWTELLDRPARFLEYQYFPRICALAEVGWTNKELKNYDCFYHRLTKSHYDRLHNMGIAFRLPFPDVVYQNNPLKVKLPYDWAVVRYTTDGTEPTATSKVYTGDIVTFEPEKFRYHRRLAPWPGWSQNW